MGESGGQLSDGRKPLGTLHSLKTLPKLLVDGVELRRRTLERVFLPSFPVSQNTSDEPHQEEIQNLHRFATDVAPRLRPLVETHHEVWRVTKRGKHRRTQPSLPPKIDGCS